MEAKAAELSLFLPLSRFEQEKLNLEKTRIEGAKKAEQAKLDKEKARKLEEAELDVNNLVSMIEEFEAIKPIIFESRKSDIVARHSSPVRIILQSSICWNASNANPLKGKSLETSNPFLSYALHPEKYGTNCQHCFSNIRAVIPCPKCVWVNDTLSV